MGVSRCWLALLFFSGWTRVSCQEWSGVVRITPTLAHSTRHYLGVLVNELSERGHFGLADELAEDSGMSMGLLYVDEMGNNFILTGANVALFSDEAQVEVLTATGWRRFSGVQLLHVNDSLAVAVYVFRDMAKPFSPSDTIPFLPDGVDVPAGRALRLISSQPKGTLESEAVIKTAERGVSVPWGLAVGSRYYGTPVLWQASENDPAWVIGLALDTGRMSTISDLLTVVAGAWRVHNRATPQALRRGAEQLSTAVMTETYELFGALFTAPLRGRVGLKVLLELLDRLDSREREVFYERMLEVGGVTALIEDALANYFITLTNRQDRRVFVLLSVDDTRLPAMSETTQAIFVLNTQRLPIGWRFSAGQWRVDDLSSVGLTDTTAFLRDFSRRGIKVGMGYSFSPLSEVSARNINADATMQWDLFKYMAVGAGLSHQMQNYRVGEITQVLSVLGINSQLQLHVAMSFGAFNIMPFVGFSAGFGVRVEKPHDVSPWDGMIINRLGFSVIGGWYTGVELSVGAQPKLFYGLEGGYMGDYFGSKWLYRFNDRTSAGAFFIRLYVKVGI